MIAVKAPSDCSGIESRWLVLDEANLSSDNLELFTAADPADIVAVDDPVEHFKQLHPNKLVVHEPYERWDGTKHIKQPTEVLVTTDPIFDYITELLDSGAKKGYFCSCKGAGLDELRLKYPDLVISQCSIVGSQYGYSVRQRRVKEKRWQPRSAKMVTSYDVWQVPMAMAKLLGLKMACKGLNRDHQAGWFFSLINMFNLVYGENAHRRLTEFKTLRERWIATKGGSWRNLDSSYQLPSIKFAEWMDSEVEIQPPRSRTFKAKSVTVDLEVLAGCYNFEAGLR